MNQEIDMSSTADEQQPRFDVVVVGGGAAGLSGALALGRARRSVLVVDAGEPRNAPAGQVHNYLGREGTAPGELLAIGRAEVAQYGVAVREGVAISAAATSTGFTVTLADGGQVQARRLLVATGLTDVLPDVPGLAGEWGRTVLHCPYCHGWEVRDQAVGVLGTGAFAVHQALLFRQWTTDVTLFAHTAPPLDDEQSEQLAARGITVVHGTVAGWEGTGARMSSGELVARQALVVAPLFEASSPVLESLGLRTSPVEMGGHVFGHQYEAGANGQTSVPGVWVAGNVGDLRAQVITSAAAGLAAGAAINGDLVTADTQHAVERARVLGREAWEARYRSRAEGIWSGQPNAVLVAEVAELAPGTALDVGCGEGADAMWLAERGWQVTGVDISQVALDRAAAQGAARGLRVDWVQADLLAEPPAEAAFDLVTAHFMQLPTPERVALYDRLAAAVRPGGTLLLVGHHPLDMHTTIGRPHLPEMFFTAEELAVRLDPEVWQVQVVDARSRRATDPHGQQVTIRDAVLRACKR